MGFWIYMTAMDLLIPITMVAFGIYFSKRALKREFDEDGRRR